MPETTGTKYFSVRHVTHYRYSSPVRESIMQLYMQPRSDGDQYLRTFKIQTQPHAQPLGYTDFLGNAVYHFDVPMEHNELNIVTESAIEVVPRLDLPETLDPAVWKTLADSISGGDFWDMLHPSAFARPHPFLDDFISERGITPEGDPLSAIRRLNMAIHGAFAYDGDHTHVHSPIADALRTRKGVCQDFAHVMIAVLRSWDVPARYVSGYLHHRVEDHDQSDPSASHAWVEAWLPPLGWVGFDPTNNVLADGRHIRVAIGRDYADVPPTRGTFKGTAESELAVAVTVALADGPVEHEDFLKVVRPMPRDIAPAIDPTAQHQQQQQL